MQMVVVTATLPEALLCLLFFVTYLAGACIRLGDATAKVDHLNDTGVDGGFIVLARARVFGTGTEVFAGIWFIIATLVAIAGYGEDVIWFVMVGFGVLIANGFMFMKRLREAVRRQREFDKLNNARDASLAAYSRGEAKQRSSEGLGHN